MAFGSITGWIKLDYERGVEHAQHRRLDEALTINTYYSYSAIPFHCFTDDITAVRDLISWHPAL